MQGDIKYRHEYKLQLNHADYLALSARLKRVMQRDPHAGADGRYVINSLYFDNVYDRALLEKLFGVDDREKFRIRYYGSDTSQLHLEKKLKRRGMCAKLTEPISLAQCQALLQQDYSPLHSGGALQNELYIKHRAPGLYPKTIVRYTREPFVYAPGNVRITVDSDLRAGGNPADFLHPERPLLPAAPGMIILEVKYDGFLPDVIAAALQLNCRSVGAFSKYAACRIYG